MRASISVLRLGAALLMLLGGSASAGAEGGALTDDAIQEILAQLRSDDRAERAYGAMAVQRVARERWGFSLWTRTDLRPWQRQIAPVVSPLIAVLEDDSALQWLSAEGATMVENATTPRREAALALLALERAAVEPLIDALAGPRAAAAAEVLRRLIEGGPPTADTAAWRRFWAENRHRPLRNEAGRWPLVAALVLATATAIALVLWRARVRDRRADGPRLSLRGPVG